MHHKSKSAATVRTADWKDSSWREEVLEPLQLQLHDARVTCDTHRDALVALQAEHESLQADLALVKMERAELAEQNEQLRMVIRKMETERAKAMEDSASELERMQRSEEALIKARIELAEADEERSLLVRQLNNLRKFVSETTAGGDASVSPINETNAQMHQRRARMMSTDGGVSIPASPTSASAKQGRFSISNFASNWSALRGAIVSPRASMQQDSSSASPASPVLGSNGSDDAVSLMSVAASVASGTPPSLTDKQGKRATIPMASLHRSKTTSAILTTSAMASAELPPLDDAESMSPRVPISGSRQDAWAKLNGGSH
ncbi:hypothetical protein GQ54DRAFT_261711 [Martensiomyces pterosporus]|nr:hypothetical protein GQ54DRAFT_261711 [Martensiomyces pterosporus]